MNNKICIGNIRNAYKKHTINYKFEMNGIHCRLTHIYTEQKKKSPLLTCKYFKEDLKFLNNCCAGQLEISLRFINPFKFLKVQEFAKIL